jgi:hypothetical protein
MTVIDRARALVARRGQGPAHLGDRWATLPPALPLSVWSFSLLAFLAVYLFMFTYVHIVADTRLCLLRLDDPLMSLIPHDDRWLFITVDVYIVISVIALATVIAQACLGDHRPMVRWGLGLAITGSFRACTILLVPLCRWTRQPGTAALTSVPTLDLGFVEIPWRMLASNDLLFSGHVCEFILLLRATRSWPAWARSVIWAFQILQIIGLIGGRGHYSVDILIAIPIAVCADHAAYQIVHWFAKRRPASVR